MKKLITILLALILLLGLSGICYGDIEDEPIPGAPTTVDSEMYGTEETILDDGIPESGVKTETVVDEAIPKALPKTGGIPAEAFYVAGGLFIVAAVIISMKKAKA